MKSMCLIWSDGAVAKHKNIMCICLVVLISLWSDLCCLDVSWHLSAFLANAALCWQFSSTSTWTLFKVPVHDNVIGRHFYTNKQQRRSRGQQNKTKQNPKSTLEVRWGGQKYEPVRSLQGVQVHHIFNWESGTLRSVVQGKSTHSHRAFVFPQHLDARPHTAHTSPCRPRASSASI